MLGIVEIAVEAREQRFENMGVRGVIEVDACDRSRRLGPEAGSVRAASAGSTTGE